MAVRGVLLALAAAGLLAGCTLDSFMFEPVPLDGYVVPDSVIPASQREMVVLQQDGHTIYGFFVQQPDSLSVEPHPVVLYHHGNDENIPHFWPRVEYLYRCGFDVFIYDYRGYGMSTGELASEDDLLADAELAWNYVRSRSDVDTTQIVEYGFSLGCVPAIWLAAERHHAHAVIAEAPYRNAETLVQTGTILNIPGRYVLKGTFNNEARIPQIGTKLLMLHGTADDFIPIDKHGDPLFQVARNPKTYVRVEGAGHSTIPTTMGVETYIDIITAFVRGA